MLKNSPDKVKITVAKHMAYMYGLPLQGSPRTSRKHQQPLPLDTPEQEYGMFYVVYKTLTSSGYGRGTFQSFHEALYVVGIPTCNHWTGLLDS